MIYIAIAILIPVVLAVLFPKQTERVFVGMMMFKRYVIGGIGLIFAALFIMTGSAELMLIGGLILAYGVWFLWFETDAGGAFQ